MSLWRHLDAANNAPVSSAMAGYGGNTPQVTANAEVYYANTKLGSFSDNQAIGIVGVTAGVYPLIEKITAFPSQIIPVGDGVGVTPK